MTVADPMRPAAISLIANRNELSIQAPDAVEWTASFNTRGSDAEAG
jgi:hypothetical protein